MLQEIDLRNKLIFFETVYSENRSRLNKLNLKSVVEFGSPKNKNMNLGKKIAKNHLTTSQIPHGWFLAFLEKILKAHR